MDISPRPVYENPVTGERVIRLTDPRDHPDEALVAHLLVTPGGRVAAPHLHPTVEERFLVMRGHVGLQVGEWEKTLGPGEHATVAPGTVHDWWQVGEETAEVIVEVVPGIRFGEMVASIFGLARDGKVSSEGLPDPLQLAVMGAEYGDVIAFTSPPRLVQRLTMPPLALIGRLVGKKPMYEEYVEPGELADPDPGALARLTEDGRLRPFERE